MSEFDNEANAFAICLLMPEYLVRKEIKKIGSIDLADDRQTKRLAKLFGVSETLMALRIASIFKIKLP